MAFSEHVCRENFLGQRTLLQPTATNDDGSLFADESSELLKSNSITKYDSALGTRKKKLVRITIINDTSLHLSFVQTCPLLMDGRRRSFNQFRCENECVFCSDDLELERADRGRRARRENAEESSVSQIDSCFRFYAKQKKKQTRITKNVSRWDRTTRLICHVNFECFIVIQNIFFSEDEEVKIDTRKNVSSSINQTATQLRMT